MKSLVVMQFDMRRAPQCPDSFQQRYKACLEMIARADTLPVSVIGLSEHHNTPDGFLSAPLMLASAAAAVTQRVAISISALQLPLHEPLRVAEDIAALDLISSGRCTLTLGLGYRELEYQSFNQPWQRRGKLLDEKLGVLLRALSGEPFEYHGTTVQVQPAPQTPPRSLLLMGGNSVAAARRAARFGLMFAPAIDDPALQQAYEQACSEYDFKHGFVVFPQHPSLTLIAEDPDAMWAQVGEYLLYDATQYASWRHASRRAYAESAATSLQQLREEGKYAILTPAQALEKIELTGSINLAPLMGGVPLEHAWSSVELFAQKVAPELPL